MSRWGYDIEHPPAQSFEAVEGFVSLLKTADLLSSPLYLGSNDRIYAHEDNVTAGESVRRVVVTEWQQMGGKFVEPSGLLTVDLHIRVIGEKAMQNFARWHASMHARIAQSTIGKALTLTRSETGWLIRQLTEPTRPEYYPETDTRESYALYRITLQSNQPS